MTRMFPRLVLGDPPSHAAIVSMWSSVFVAYLAPGELGARELVIELARPVDVPADVIDCRLARGWSAHVLGTLVCGLLTESSLLRVLYPVDVTARAARVRLAFCRVLLHATASRSPCSLVELAKFAVPT
jgi:hypothetical protein